MNNNDSTAESSAESVRGINHDSVSDWLDANVPGVSGPYSFEFIVGGHSNLTYLVTGGDGS